ncbi:C39 family peptidase [Paenibacillus sp. KN14-4R]|uniref:C39 family peptidase n=1 Tax=Paenibacillus sp. KN14-4R TaxID=3445773 RepID=UPI003F9FBE93
MVKRWRQVVIFAITIGVVVLASSINPTEEKVAMPTSLPDTALEMDNQVEPVEITHTEDQQDKPIMHQASVRIPVPLILQNPELYNGCEVTALTMLLDSAGVDVDKMTLATQVKKDPTLRTENDGILNWGDPNMGFVGSITGETAGYGVYHGPIRELAEQYLPDRIVDLTGSIWEKIEDYLRIGSPVWVITNDTFDVIDEADFQTWESAEGPVKATIKEHSVLVVGYDEKFVYINDPLGVTDHVEKDAFLRAWEQMGMQAISYQSN